MPSGRKSLVSRPLRHRNSWLAYFSIALLLVHLLLNWRWLVKVAASKHVWRLAAGILIGLFVVGAFLLT